MEFEKFSMTLTGTKISSIEKCKWLADVYTNSSKAYEFHNIVVTRLPKIYANQTANMFKPPKPYATTV